MAKHRARMPGRRGAIIAAGALLASFVATGLAGATAVPTVQPTGPNTAACINAKAILTNAQTAQAAAQAAFNKATEDRDDALDDYNEAISDSDPTNDAAALAALNSAKDALLIANLLLNERTDATKTAQAVVDKACADPAPPTTTTPPPTTTRPPVSLPDGDTHVVLCVLRPGVCAEVEVDTETRLVRVVREIKCPTSDLPVATGSRKGDRVTVVERIVERDPSTTIIREAPAPVIVQDDLAVTH